MKHWLLNIAKFTPIACLIYLGITYLSTQHQPLDKRWNNGVPNFTKHRLLERKLEYFTKINPSNIILGSSTALHGIIPDLLGTNYFSLASQAQTAAGSLFLYNLISRTAINPNNQVDTVIIDIYPVINLEMQVSRGDHLGELLSAVPIRHLNTSLISNGNFHMYHSAIAQRLRADTSRYDPNILKGYRPISMSFEHDTVNWDGVLEPNFSEALSQMSQLESTTILINPPVLHMDYLHSLSIPANLLVINGNEWPGSKDTSNYIDNHHLNHQGALKYSLWLKTRLSSSSEFHQREATHSKVLNPVK